MLGSRDLVLCSGTVRAASFEEMADAAHAAGFQAISLWADDVERARARGLRDDDMKRILADCSLQIAELDPLLSWLQSGSLGEGAADGSQAMLGRSEDEFFAIADALGGTTLNCAHPFPGEVDLDHAAETFAGLCDRAREHGLTAVIEFLPWTGIPDVATADAIVERAGRDNGGIMLDTWHYFRGSSTAEQLRAVTGTHIQGVQINSAPAEPQGNPMVESMGSRLLPNEGAIDVAEIIRTLDSIGCRAPIGVEVFSDELDTLPPSEAAARCAAATREVLSNARP